MKTVKTATVQVLPEIAQPEGFTTLTPLEMNGVYFSSRRTVITPAMLQTMQGASSPKPAKD